jgi:hypothetical protein
MVREAVSVNANLLPNLWIVKNIIYSVKNRKKYALLVYLLKRKGSMKVRQIEQSRTSLITLKGPTMPSILQN